MNRFPRPVMILAAALVAVFALTGCTKVMDADKVEKSGKSFLKGKLGDEKFDKVKCPDDEDAKTGNEFECTFEGSDGTTGKLNVEVTSKDGDATITVKSVKYTADYVQDQISDDFKTTYPDSAADLQSVECPDDIPSEAGETVACSLTSSDGQSADLTVTVGEDLGLTWDFTEITGG